MWETKEKPTFSFEFFPARTEKSASKLENSIKTLTDLKPDFVAVTFGAGGSTREGSHNLVDRLKNDFGLETVAYFAGYGLGKEDIHAVMDSYWALGVENILVVRGDPPHDGEFSPHPESFSYASEILEFVRPKYDFCMGVAGYPEGHIEAQSKEKDLEHLKHKVDQGAEYIICNYFYDNRYFYDFTARSRGAGIDVPILPGVMPIYSVKMMENLARLCGATITEEIRNGIADLPEGDKEALNEFGIEFAVRQCTDLIKNGAIGLHIYTMDRSSSAVGIVTRLRSEGLL